MTETTALSWPHNKILYTKDGRVAVVTKNRPEKVNAMDEEMEAAYDEALADAEADPEIRVIIVTGTGRGWHPGANPQMFVEGKKNMPPWWKPHGEGAVSPLRRSDKVTLGAINGHAYGAGFGEALWCDLRVMAESANFGPSWARFGAPLENGTSVNLTNLVGPAKTMELYLLREPIPAPRALELGLVNYVVPDDQLMPFSMDLAQRVARNAPYATALSKYMIYKHATPDIETHMEFYRFAEETTGRSLDSKEGGAAFRERREPEFRGE